MFFLMLGTAIVAFQAYRLMSDEISRIVAGIIAQFCLVISLVYAPWFIQLIAVIAIISLFPGLQEKLLE